MGSIDKLKQLSAEFGAATPARDRLTALFDEGSFVELDAFLQAGDEKAGVIAGYGLLEGGVVYAFSQDASVDHGAVSRMHAKKIKKVYELAAKTGCPLIGIFDSAGAKVTDSAKMLSAYSKILKCANNLSGVVPQIALILGPCAGVSSLLAAGADFVVMDKKAELFLTPPFTAKAHGNKEENLGSAENAAKAGLASLVYDSEEEAIGACRRLLTLLPQNNISDTPRFEFASPAADFDPDGCPKEILKGIADEGSLLELSPDCGKAAFTFLGTMAGASAGFVVTSRNHPLASNDCGKAARFVRFCDAFNVPIVTLIGSDGFDYSGDANLIREASRLSSAYAEATSPKVSVIFGKASGALFMTLASKNAGADITAAWPQAEISALPVDTAVEFLWEDKKKGASDAKEAHQKLAEEYAATEASPIKAAQSGLIEAVIAPTETRAFIVRMLDMLSGKRESGSPKKHTTV